MEEPIITFGTESLILEMLPEPVVEPLPEPELVDKPFPDTELPYDHEPKKGWCILS